MNGVNATASPPKSPPIPSADSAPQPAPPVKESKMDPPEDEMKLVGDQPTPDQPTTQEEPSKPTSTEEKVPENTASETAPAEKAPENALPAKEQSTQDVPKPSTESSQDTRMETVTPASQEPAVVKSQSPNHATQSDALQTSNNDATGAAPPALPAQNVDQEMPDAPQAPMSPTKLSRERETDPSEEPAAKRTKVEGEESTPAESKVPELPTPTTEPPAENLMEGKPGMTKLQHKFLLRGMGGIKRMHNARFYREPVDPIKMNIPHYPQIITNPMDLGTIEKKLKNNEYPNPQVLIDDFNLMVNNSVTFNGADHPVAQEGLNLKVTFDKQMTRLPKPEEVEEKKPKKAPQKTSAARREPRTSMGQTTAPKTGGTFALSPDGLPLIRRDSTTADGRPKRSIHPPKRDLPYSTKPKKKKFQWELRFCQEVLDELHKAKHFNYASPFYYPVDPVALNIPTYHSIIKKPMDLSTMQSKLKTGQYENSKEFEIDMRQMFKNCFKFNIPGDPTYVAGQTLQGVFNNKWETKARYLEAHEPQHDRHTASSSEESSDEEADDSDDADEQLTMLQRQMAELSRQVEAITHKKKKTPPGSKKPSKSKSVKKDSKKGRTSSSFGKKEKKSKPSKAEKDRWVTYHEKQIISNGISSLPDKKMQEALKIIQSNVPSLKVCYLRSCPH